MKSSASKIQLTGYDALFQTSDPVKVNGDLVQEVPLSELFPFKNHPFQVRDDEAMQKTVRVSQEAAFSPPALSAPGGRAATRSLQATGASEGAS